MVWYNPNKSSQQISADEAECRNMVRLNQNGIPLNEGGLVGVLSIVGENNRENDIYSDCMISKGYWLINTNGLALLLNNSQVASDPVNSNGNKKAANDLIGHWESVALSKAITEIAGKIDYDFLTNNQMVETAIQKGKSNTASGTYYVEGDVLVMFLSTAPAPQIIAAKYTLTGDSLVILDVNGNANSFTKGKGISP